MSIQQLIKKNCPNGGFKEVHPRTWIEAIKDKLTDIGLDEILAAYNMLYLPYIGSREDTRLQVPKFLRRKGLWITYVDYDDKIRTEWYNSNHLGDEHWQSDIHWNTALEMSDILDWYFSSDTFHNTFVQAVTNAVKNIIGDINIGGGVDEETVRRICQEIIDGLDLSNEIQNAVNNYINSDEFNNKLEEYFNNLDLSQNIDNSVNKYLDGKDLSTIINNAINDIIKDIDWSQYIDLSDLSSMIQEAVNNYLNNSEEIANLVNQAISNYLKDVNINDIIQGIDFSEEIQEAVNNWFANNGDTLVELMRPVLEELVDKLREELIEWCNDIERVVANALIRHEQWIQEHS